MGKLKQLSRYKYEFTWEHQDSKSIITGMTVLSPISKKMLSTAVGPLVTVYDMMVDRPYVILGRLFLQDLEAITEEIKVERKRLWEEQDV